MKDQDEMAHTKGHTKGREDENDVEGHALNHTKGHTKGREDENDVEGHALNHTKGHTKGREDDGDDVEGHLFKQAPAPAKHKA